jgi:hypothetical protein
MMKYGIEGALSSIRSISDETFLIRPPIYAKELSFTLAKAHSEKIICGSNSE